MSHSHMALLLCVNQQICLLFGAGTAVAVYFQLMSCNFKTFRFLTEHFPKISQHAGTKRIFFMTFHTDGIVTMRTGPQLINSGFLRNQDRFCKDAGIFKSLKTTVNS